jgi:hypothetical protein
LKGTDRTNLTQLIDSYEEFPEGAPVKVPIEDGAFVILGWGTATLYFQVEAEMYSWYQLFERDSPQMYSIFLYALPIAVALYFVILPSVIAVFLCIFCTGFSVNFGCMASIWHIVMAFILKIGADSSVVPILKKAKEPRPQ